MTTGVLNNLAAIGKQLSIGNKVNVVAVHSRQVKLPSELIEQCYDHAIQWMCSLGVEPKSFSSFGVSGFQEAKNYSFLSADKKLRKRGFKNVESIGLSASPPVRGLFETNPNIEFSITSAQVEWGLCTIVWAWDEKYKPLESSATQELFKKAENWGFLDYAFSSVFNSKDYPLERAYLTAFETMEKKGYMLSTYIGFSSKESFEVGRHVIDFLREIYPYQILSPIHLSYRIGELTLEDWIKSSSAHGFLRKFAQNRWLWEIPEDQLPVVRQVLIENNLLTLYLPDMNRILEDYGKPGK